jgi:hypothetical protein
VPPSSEIGQSSDIFATSIICTSNAPPHSICKAGTQNLDSSQLDVSDSVGKFSGLPKLLPRVIVSPPSSPDISSDNQAATRSRTLSAQDLRIHSVELQSASNSSGTAAVGEQLVCESDQVTRDQLSETESSCKTALTSSSLCSIKAGNQRLSHQHIRRKRKLGHRLAPTVSLFQWATRFPPPFPLVQRIRYSNHDQIYSYNCKPSTNLDLD